MVILLAHEDRLQSSVECSDTELNQVTAAGELNDGLADEFAHLRHDVFRLFIPVLCAEPSETNMPRCACVAEKLPDSGERGKFIYHVRTKQIHIHVRQW